MQRNFMNYNEVYPILDLIGRVQSRKKGTARFGDVGGDVSGEAGVINLPVDLRVTKLEVERDEANPVMSGVIVKLNIEYENGATATLDIHRGLKPQVGSNVDDFDFINHVMIVGLTMVTEYAGSKETMELVIIKEGGYGSLKGIEVAWDGKLYETIQLDDEEDKVDVYEEPEEHEYDDDEEVEEENNYEFENPNDFYDNGASQQVDTVISQGLGDFGE